MTIDQMSSTHWGTAIVAMYREARENASDDFKLTGLTRAMRLLPATSASWMNGVVLNGVPVMHDHGSIGLPSGWWDTITSLITKGCDPLGPAMFGAPGRSWVTLPDFFPAEFRTVIHERYDINSALTGLYIDAKTSNFSTVCFYRDHAMPVFSEQERQVHEQLLPHWLESLTLHRILRAMRECEGFKRPGRSYAVVETTGLIHYAQPNFEETIKMHYPEWMGGSLPVPLLRSLENSGVGTEDALSVCWEKTNTPGLMRVEMESLANTPVSVGSSSNLEQLAKAYTRSQRHQLIAEERQRIVRELHDGVGSQLVGLTSLIQRVPFNPDAAVQGIQETMDELRLAVDAMQTDTMSVALALAEVRYRLQPRFDAVGIQIHWNLAQELGEMEMVTYEVFHLKRIFLEAFTNILKHSKAHRVEVFGRVSRAVSGTGSLIEIEMKDDGVGLQVSHSTLPGHGVRNMRYRAGKLGGHLTINSVSPRGTSLRLNWPIGVSSR